MAELAPKVVLGRLAAAMPEEVRPRVTIVGSVAAAYSLFDEQDDVAVRTKDVDCVLAPHIRAVEAGSQIARELLAANWTQSTERPAAAKETPAADLPVVRLYPPDGGDWFIELLTVPSEPGVPGRQFTRLSMPDGDFGLPSFPYLGVATHDPLETEWGIRVARVEMMALANLLEHPTIGEARISAPMGGRYVKRSNKDLGRVIALARLSADDALSHWPKAWRAALHAVLPESMLEATARVPQGIAALLSSAEDVEEAWHAANVGLLAGRGVTLEQFSIAGRRLEQDVIVPFTAVGDDDRKGNAPKPQRTREAEGG